jgi:hypothetical protein
MGTTSRGVILLPLLMDVDWMGIYMVLVLRSGEYALRRQPASNEQKAGSSSLGSLTADVAAI